jgi:hypothetical protein
MILMRVCVDFWMTRMRENTTDATRPVFRLSLRHETR